MPEPEGPAQTLDLLAALNEPVQKGTRPGGKLAMGPSVGQRLSLYGSVRVTRLVVRSSGSAVRAVYNGAPPVRV